MPMTSSVFGGSGTHEKRESPKNTTSLRANYLEVAGLPSSWRGNSRVRICLYLFIGFYLRRGALRVYGAT
jgi:hypothetical protein